MADLIKYLLKLKISHIFYLSLTVAAVISLIIFSVSYSKIYFDKLEKNIIEDLRIKISLASEIIEKNINQNEISDVEAAIAYLSTQKNIENVFLINPKGKVIIASKKKFTGENIKEIYPFLRKNQIYRENIKYFFNKDKSKIFFIESIFLRKKGEIRPKEHGVLLVEYNFLNDKISSLYFLLSNILIFLGSIIIAGFILNTVFKKYISRRIENVINVLEKVSHGDLDTMVKVQGNDEIRLISEHINQMIKKLRNYIYYDYLTGVYNRYFFEKKVKAEISNKNKFALVIFDTDNFKEINDLFGHIIGDKLLQNYAHRLKNFIGEKGFVGRFGGDEFLIYIDGKYFESDSQLIKLVNQIIEYLDKPFFIEDYKLDITSTAGISKYPEHGKTYEDLLKIADISLFHGKKIGKNLAILADNDIIVKSLRKAQLTSFIKSGIENKEFFLVYQPIFSIKNLKIVGVEALLRWNSKKFGFISPAEFIPILEETGLIKDVGKWIFKEVLQQAEIWENQGIEDIKINVNVDIQQILEANFTEFVKDEILSKNFSKVKLGIEITESEAMQYPDLIIDKLKTLRELGIKISIDDFGTGNSSLSYLKIMSIDYLKIDKSFIDD
ncbi:EAL domain-containing protein, partial [Hydrogenivirga sp. 128-5-R1-1]|uniref:EAL domain-containing protein n=1 Tax=Hydrogenivirga sp. 128-5-R1-1 TaxID=392423 RepID=UPI00015F1086